MDNYNGRKKRQNGRIIRSTALFITPLMLGLACSTHFVLSLFEDDIQNLRLQSKLDDYVMTDTVLPSEEEENNNTIDITNDSETGEVVVVIPEPEEEKPFERVSSELFDIDYEIPEIDFVALNEINPDVVGWIRIDGTVIDFPLLQGTDNEHYLKYDVEDKKNINGSIFLDCNSNSLDSEMSDLSDVSYIYGHHMSSGAMFAQLCKFKDQQFLNDHPFGIIRTESGDIYKLDFFAGMVVNGADGSAIYTGTDKFADEDEFQAYYDSVRERAMVSSDIDLQLGDKVIALVTCSYETNNSRFVLYARMTKQLEKINEQTNDNVRTYTLN